MNIAKTMEKDNENNNFVNIVSKVEHRFCYLLINKGLNIYNDKTR